MKKEIRAISIHGNAVDSKNIEIVHIAESLFGRKLHIMTDSERAAMKADINKRIHNEMKANGFRPAN